MSSLEDKRPAKRQRTLKEAPSSQTLSRKLKNRMDSWLRHLAAPNIPIILSSYLRVVMRVIGIYFILVVTFKILKSFALEIEERCQLQLKEYAEKARQCHKNYVSHHCGPQLTGAVWQSMCKEWDRYPL